MKKFLIFSMLVALFNCSCGSNSNSLIGEYKKISGHTCIVGINILNISKGEASLVIFCEPGCACSQYGSKMNATYDKENNKIFGSLFDSFTISYMDDIKIEMKWGNEVLIFSKIKK